MFLLQNEEQYDAARSDVANELRNVLKPDVFEQVMDEFDMAVELR